MNSTIQLNALQHETSPYLLQHADNPVDWYPWGPSALARAQLENKPILLSIGYSACHWCHVMAHESFEDPQTADLMNQWYINIKVDREERPDLDKIYQSAHYLLTRKNGGWPLTLFLMPESHIPFFAGTYFPPQPRFGLPSFKEVLQHVAYAYHNKIEEIHKQNESVMATLQQMEVSQQSEDIRAIRLNSEPLAISRKQMESSYDSYHGGFGSAPKFPHPPNLVRLLRHYAASVAVQSPDEIALGMVKDTLRSMANGGIYDQLAGGFSRYSVDEAWMIPHFEKMLYDNAQLLQIYSQAWQITSEPRFAQIAQETADWVLRDMTSPEGGFYSSLDADSEGHEGKFYVWDRHEIRRILNDDQQYALITKHFGLDQTPNFEGSWHLHVRYSIVDLAAEFQLSENYVSTSIKQAREKLLNVRNQRIWPGRDEKLLTSWNALMIKGLVIAGTVFERDDYLSAATKAVDFISDNLWKNNRLLATYKDGRAHLNAYLDDYAFLIDALLTCLQAHWRQQDLTFANQLASVLLEAFHDRENGGMFFTSHDHEQLIQRNKPLADEAIPAGMGIAASALGRLGQLSGNTDYLAVSEEILQFATPTIEQYPSVYNSLLDALEDYLDPPTNLIIRGEAVASRKWLRRALAYYAPQRMAFFIDNADNPNLGLDFTSSATTTAYFCEGLTCKAPTQTFDKFEDALMQSEVR